LRARGIHQNSAHYLSGQGEELGPMLPIDVLYIHQAKIRFVDQSRGLQRDARALILHIAPRHAV
jgi:hypothetical protein